MAAKTKIPKPGKRPKNKTVTKKVHGRLKAMCDIGCNVRSILVESGVQQKEIAEKYGFRIGDVSYVVTRGTWPPRGHTSQQICRAICAELGLPIDAVFPENDHGA